MYGNKPAIGIIILVIIAFLLPAHYYNENVYPLKVANGYINRALASGFAEEMIEYSKLALEILKPYEGNPAWWFPNPTTNFDLIKNDLALCIARLEILTDLPPTSDAYQQGLDDVRGKLKVIQGNISSCASWVFFSLQNIFYSIVWFIVLIIVVYVWMRY